MSNEFPPIAQLLPQAGAMRLLECVLAHDDEGTRCRVNPSQSALFRDASGRVPAWVALEYMAQCAAADGSLRRRARGLPLEPALLIGSRRVAFRCAGFEAAQRLEVTARHAAGRRELLAFDCAVFDARGGEPLVEGRLNVLPLRGRTSSTFSTSLAHPADLRSASPRCAPDGLRSLRADFGRLPR